MTVSHDRSRPMNVYRPAHEAFQQMHQLSYVTMPCSFFMLSQHSVNGRALGSTRMI